MIDRLTSNDFWDASLLTTGDDAQLAEEAKVAPDRDEFLKLFFRNQNKAVETFQLLLESYYLLETANVSLTLSYFFDSTTKKTIPFPVNWREESLSQEIFSNSQNPTTYGSWINFLRTATTQTLNENKADPNNFFWEQFFKAYLFFVGLSRSTPYSNESFLLFLENCLVSMTVFYFPRILSLKKVAFLQYLPGDTDLKSLGKNSRDLSSLPNLNLDTFSLKDLNSDLVKLLKGCRDYKFFNFDENFCEGLNTPYKANIQLLKGLVEQKDFWTTLNVVLKNNFGIKFLFLNGTRYDLENLITSFSHYDSRETINNFILATNQFREELTKLIFANKRGIQYGVDSPEKLLKLFNDTKKKLLTDLKTGLDQIVSFDSTITQLTIKGKPYDLNHLIVAKDQILENDFATKHQQAFAQAKILVNDLITSDQINISNQIQTALDQFNNEKLNTLWTELQPKLVQYANLSSFQITIGSGDNAKVYALDQLFQDQKETTGSNLPNGKSQLQTLVNDGVSVQQITTQLDDLLQKANETETKKQKVAEIEKKQNLAIGLGTAGGVVALAGAGGFAYWFLKIRKS